MHSPQPIIKWKERCPMFKKLFGFRFHSNRHTVKRISATTLALAMAIAIFFSYGTHTLAAEKSTFYVCFPLYLESGIYVFPVKYTLPETSEPIRAALEALIRGVPDSEVLYPMFPTDAKVLSVSVKDGLCTVDFSEEIMHMSVGSGGELAAIEAIVSTVCGFSGVDRVQILIAGQPAESLAGHVDISHPLTRNYDRMFVPLEDVTQHWSGGYVGALQILDIVHGYEDMTFRPEKTVSRAEFVKMAVESCGAQSAPDQDIPFDDVSGHWVVPYLKDALASGIVDPAIYGSNFRPDETITREEMALILVRAQDIYLAQRNQSPPPPCEITFEDSDSIGEAFVEAVREAASRKLLQGYPGGTFKPKSGLKRGEAATAIARLRGIRGNTGVVIMSPENEAALGDEPVYILGLATAFEANVNLDILAEDQSQIIADFATSTNGIGWGVFGYALSAHQLGGYTPTVIRVYLVSAKDGSLYSIVNIPVSR